MLNDIYLEGQKGPVKLIGGIMETTKKTNGLTLLRDTRGLSTVEYVIILALIAVAGIGLWTKFGTTVKNKITDSDKKMGDMKVE